MKIIRVLLALAAMVYAPALYAAPFCVEKQGLPKECNYYDALACRQRSNQLGGVCTTNPSEITLQKGPGRFCVVTSSRISQCNYADRTTCDSEAGRAGAVCVEFPDVEIQPNPYKIDPNSKY